MTTGSLKRPTARWKTGRSSIIAHQVRRRFQVRLQEIVRESEAKAEMAACRRPAKSCHDHLPSFYLTAWEEEEFTIAQANAELDDKGHWSPSA